MFCGSSLPSPDPEYNVFIKNNMCQAGSTLQTNGWVPLYYCESQVDVCVNISDTSMDLI